jgi:hypothetical protein
MGCADGEARTGGDYGSVRWSKGTGRIGQRSTTREAAGADCSWTVSWPAGHGGSDAGMAGRWWSSTDGDGLIK